MSYNIPQHVWYAWSMTAEIIACNDMETNKAKLTSHVIAILKGEN